MEKLNNTEQDESISRQRLKCYVCMKEFEVFELQIHFDEMHSGAENKLKCNFCDNVFLKETNLKAHIKNVHSNIIQSKENVLSIFKCDMCDKSLKSLYSFHNHTKVVHDKNGQKKVPCLICGLSLATDKSAKEHFRNVHKELTKLECEICENTFSNKNIYERQKESIFASFVIKHSVHYQLPQVMLTMFMEGMQPKFLNVSFVKNITIL